MDKLAGQRTSAADVRYALGRAVDPRAGRKPYYGYRSGINEDDFEEPKTGNRMLEAKDYASIPKEDLTIEYVPYKF